MIQRAQQNDINANGKKHDTVCSTDDSNANGMSGNGHWQGFNFFSRYVGPSDPWSKKC